MLAAFRRSLAWIGGASLSIRPTALVAGAVAGVAVTAATSLIPARRAARLDAVAAMAETHSSDVRPPRHWAWGAALIIIGTTLAQSGSGLAALGGVILI